MLSQRKKILFIANIRSFDLMPQDTRSNWRTNALKAAPKIGRGWLAKVWGILNENYTALV